MFVCALSSVNYSIIIIHDHCIVCGDFNLVLDPVKNSLIISIPITLKPETTLFLPQNHQI